MGDLPATMRCGTCGGGVRWSAAEQEYVHVDPGIDHIPFFLEPIAAPTDTRG